MNAAEIQSALDDVFDQALDSHGFTDYMRDYEVIVSTTADPRTGIPPARLRYLFRYCVSAHVDTALAAATWKSSLDDRLIDPESDVDLDGYVWGVRRQVHYLGGKVIADSEAAKRWSDQMGMTFHEIQIIGNAHVLTLICADLVVTAWP